METKQFDFTIQEAGCLLYAADRNFGGEGFTRLDDFFGGVKGLKDLVESGAIIPVSLYQDDGYNVRVRLGGEPSADEQAQWTARVSRRLVLESGTLVVSGVIPEDDELSDFGEATGTAGDDFQLGCLIEIPPGVYAATVYSYPPNDLAGGWMRLEKPGLFKACFGQDGAGIDGSGLEFEKPIDYFHRTRPGETPPGWIAEGYEIADFLDFLIHLTPHDGEPSSSISGETLEFESDGCLVWQYRKPEICPVGIRLGS